jgi:ClpX C4-type zinc finger protein
MAITARPTTDTRKRDLEIPSADQRWKLVRAHIAKGDKAKDKAEQHYIAAGQYLKQLKADCPDQKIFLEKVEREIGIGKSRTYELLQIGDGRKTVEQIRADTGERTAKTRALQSRPLRSGQNNTADDNCAEGSPPRSTSGDENGAATNGGDDGAQPSRAPPRCTFCRKCHHHAQLLIVATDGVHGICDECVDLYTNIVREHREKVARVTGAVPAEPPPASRGEENADAPETAAEAMKAKFAASNDDGLDIPEYLRRAPKAMTA